jgi:indole-3-acetate monooxygenase
MSMNAFSSIKSSNKSDDNAHAARMQHIRELLPLLEAEADQGEALTHLTDKASNTMRDAGLFHLLMPRELGGEEVSFVEAIEATELIAWADGAAGWYILVGNVISASMGAYLPDAGAAEIYGSRPYTMSAGQGVPRGQARRVDGGYMIKGPWGYGSTIQHAEYAHSGCFLMEDGKMIFDANGAPEAIVTHFPMSEVELKGNWDTLGLRGTGSYDYDIKQPEIFVPEHLCYPFVGGKVYRGGNQYSVGIIGFTSYGHTAWALGVTRRALDEVKKLAPAKAGPFGALGDGAHFRHQYATCEAKFRAARALVYSVWSDLQETLDSGAEASVEQISLIRMAMRHVHDVGSEVTTFCHRAAGGASLRSSILQRAYRDMHSGTQHVLLADQIFQECGRVMLGMAGNNARWAGFSVISDAEPA